VVLLAGCSPFKSEVPIITVDTHGRAIFDQPKVAAEMAIHYDPADSTQTLTSRVDYQGAIGIEYIGHSSLRFRKKSYGLVLRDRSGGRRAAPLLGLPSDSNWVLHGPYADKTLMRNYLAYALAARLHLQGPRTCFVEMFLRQGRWGLTYQGVYLLVEASGPAAATANEAVAAGLAACCAEASRGIGDVVQRGVLEGVILEYERGILLARYLGDAAILGVLLRDPAYLGKVRYLLKRARFEVDAS